MNNCCVQFKLAVIKCYENKKIFSYVKYFIGNKNFEQLPY